MLKKLLLICFVLLILPGISAAADLSGKWNCDDGGQYYLRQVGNTLYWYGELSAANPAWSNIYQGRIQGDRIEGSWVDVPKGQSSSRGILNLRIKENDNVLEVTHKTGGFGGSRWMRVGYVPGVAPIPAVREDCVGFNPNTAEVKQYGGRWKIVDGNHAMFDFGNDENEARQALRIIKHYRMNQSCFVGRPNPSFSYLLVGGQAPAGSFPGEDCIAFNPDTIEVKRVSGSWKIVDGSHWMFDFGNKENEARQAFAVIKKHGFTRSCFVGRPGPSFQYLRK
jgi:hypothetical protein